MMAKCDFCGGDNNDNNSSLAGVIYGIMGENTSPDYKMTINKWPSEDDDTHICHRCLEKLSNEFLKIKGQNVWEWNSISDSIYPEVYKDLLFVTNCGSCYKGDFRNLESDNSENSKFLTDSGNQFRTDEVKKWCYIYKPND